MTKYFSTLLIAVQLLFNQSIIGQKNSIETFIRSFAGEHQFNGTVLVQKDSAILCHKSFGLANRQFDISATNETLYKVASITKAFTSVLILQLYDDKKLELNKTINYYLQDYKGEAGSRVTIHQLLNHTSGMRQIDTISNLNNAFKYGLGYLQKPLTSEALFHLFEQDSLKHKPGEKWEYNNYEYIILGKIIEKLYNKTYEEVLQERILNPLNMNNSGLIRQNNIIRNLASTYFTGNDHQILVNDIPVYMENWYSAGAMYSSTIDLLKFSNALFNLKLIKKESLELMLTPGLEEYGYGVWIRGNGTDRRMERYGRIMGANAVWMEFLNEKITIIILSNTNLTDLGEFALGIRANFKSTNP